MDFVRSFATKMRPRVMRVEESHGLYLLSTAGTLQFQLLQRANLL